MRKRLAAVLLVFCLAAPPAYASGGMRHRIGDWFATLGKSGTEKEAILARRRTRRAAKRAQKEARKHAKQQMKGR